MLSAAGPREHVLQENQGKGQQEEGSFECQDMSVLSVTLASFSHGCREYEGGNFVGREGRRRCVYRRERKRERERERKSRPCEKIPGAQGKLQGSPRLAA